MTTATATEKQFHPLNPLTYQVKFAKTDLAGLVAELEQAESRRKQLIVQGVSRPAEDLKLKDVEKQIGILRRKVDHINIRIEALKGDLPRIDVETRSAVGNLEAAKKRMPEVLTELEKVDTEAIKL